MTTRHSILFSLFLAGACAHGQGIPRIDSLVLRLKAEGPTTARADMLIRLAFERLYAQQEHNDTLWEAAQALSATLHYERGLAFAPMLEAVRSYREGRYANAIALMKKSSAQLDALGAPQDFLSPLAYLRVVFATAGMQQDRLAFYTAALERYQRPGFEVDLGVCHHALAGYYRSIRLYAPAVEHYMKARDCFLIASPADVPNETMVIGWTYEGWGNPKRAIPFLQEALTGFTRLGNNEEIAEILVHLAGNELALGATAQAKDYFSRSRRYWHLLDPMSVAIFRSPYVLALVRWGELDSAAVELEALQHACIQEHITLASFHGTCEVDYCGYAYFRAVGRMAAADSCLHRALNAALELRELPLVLKYRKALMGRYLESGDEHNAAIQSEAYVRLNDSLQAVANTDAVAAYEGQVKERESALEIQRQQARMRQQRIVLFAAAIGVALLIALAYVVNKGRKRSDALLHNILPEEVARELKKKGHADAKHFDHATILFTDFKGFTEASERMTPQQLVEELNTCFKAFDGIISARGIEKIKTIGDAYMCVGGLPDPSTTAPVDVVLAALEMQAFMIARGIAQAALGKPSFEMRVGIHTGPVVAGIVGVKKFAYDIWGDTVNIASRMESSGEVGQVNISESTYAMVHDTPGLTFAPRGKIQAKGKGELEMYFVQRN